MSNERQINPNFYMPPGIKNTIEEYIELSVDDSIDSDSDSLDEDDILDIEVPDDLSVVSQTVRTLPNGSQVVDVVIDIAAGEEVIDFDVRIVRA